MKQLQLSVDLQTNSIKKYIKTVMATVYDRFFIFIALVLISIVFSCRERKDLMNEPVYDGPMSSMDSIYTIMSDSGDFVVTLRAPRQNNFEGGDQEWPEGLFLENIGNDGKIISTFKADYVYYDSKENLYHAEGNVIVISMDNGDELNTEELFWSPSEKRFYTDRFVTIQSLDEIHTGEGLEANQDFTTYTILKPQGTLILNED